MKIWVKARLKDQAGQSQSLTLKIEGQGEEAELEIVFGGETPTHEAEGGGFKDEALPQDEEKGAVVEADDKESETTATDDADVQETAEETVEENGSAENPVSTVDIVAKEDSDLLQPVTAEESEEENISEAFTLAEKFANEDTSDEEAVTVVDDDDKESETIATDDADVQETAEENVSVENPVSTKAITAEETPHAEISTIPEEPEKKTLDSKWKLEEIAAQSSNFENFLGNLADFLELQKRKEYFVNVAIAATQVFKINWSTIEMTMKKNGVKWNSYDKIWTSKQVTKKFEEIGINLSIMSLIKQIATYRDFKFARTKMECLPEIPEIEDALRQMSQEADVHAKVKILLDVIGANQQVCVHQEAFYRIGSAAVQSEDLKNLETTSPFQNGNVDLEQKAKQDECLKKIIRDAGISENSAIEVRMHMTTLINNFVEKHSPDAKAIKLITFLKELQEVCT